MFVYRVEENEIGINQYRYYLTHGDSCTIKSRLTSCGVPVDTSLVRAVKFVMCEAVNNFIINEYDMELEDGWFVFNFGAEECAGYTVGTYIYEIIYEFEDGNVETTNRYFFEIMESGIEPEIEE